MWGRSYFIADIATRQTADWVEADDEWYIDVRGGEFISSRGTLVLYTWRSKFTGWDGPDHVQTARLREFTIESSDGFTYDPDRPYVRYKNASDWNILGLSMSPMPEGIEFTWPYWLLAIIVWPVSVLFILATLRRKRRARDAQCVRCGYELVNNLCPECGPPPEPIAED